MKLMHWLAVFVSVVAASTYVQAQAPLPSGSVYRLAIELTDQDGHSSPFAALRGEPTLITMFYTSCQFVCPMIAETIRRTEDALPADQRNHVHVVMVSFDPRRDTVSILHKMAAEHSLATPRWSLARTDAASVRKLAALLGIQYRQLADGDFSHTSSIILLDAEGRIVARTQELGAVDPVVVAGLRRMAAAH